MRDYEETARTLDWPEGRSWTPPEEYYKADAEDPEPVSYEAGYGKTDAGMDWLCAWKLELLDAKAAGSDTRVNAALEQLGRIDQLHAWSAFDEGTREAEKTELSRARLGDFSKVSEDVEANC